VRLYINSGLDYRGEATGTTQTGSSPEVAKNWVLEKILTIVAQNEPSAPQFTNRKKELKAIFFG
jgi:hypothetical protein